MPSVTDDRAAAALMLAAALAALLWANAAGGSYLAVWEDAHLRHWVNEGLMAFFFFLVGVEIRRERAVGELRDRRTAAIPAVAALAGMVVPALLYLAVSGGGEGARGWGIVMATDIAFVLGAVGLLGSRCPPGVRVFLLTLAVVDDIGAVAVIAAVYSDGVDLLALAGAALVIGAVAAGQHRAWWGWPAYAVAGVVAWLLTYASGVHPTVAAVALGLVMAVAPGERAERLIKPWSALLVVPLFALANAGVALGDGALGRALESPVTLGVVLGLVVGKALGVSLVTLAAVRGGLGQLPSGMRERHVFGAAALAGIGFTVSLFVTELAFDSEALREEAKVGVLMASVLAAAIGAAVLSVSRARKVGA